MYAQTLQNLQPRVSYKALQTNYLHQPACHDSSVRGKGKGMAPLHFAVPQPNPERGARSRLVQGQPAAAWQCQGAARSALQRQWAEAKPEHRVPSSTRSGLQETGVGSRQRRGTLRDTTSPSCKAITLIEHDLAQQTQFSYLLLPHALQLKLHSRRNEDKDVDYITLSFFEAHGIGHGWKAETGLHGTYVEMSFPRNFRFNM